MMSKRRKWWPFVISVVVVVTVLFVIFVKTGENRSRGKKHLIYRLKWLANTGFIGDLFAFNYGYYIKNGLNIEVKPGGPEHDAIRELQTGAAQFGVASADQVIKALDVGPRTAPSRRVEVTVIAQIYRKNPVQWIYRTSSGKIDTPADLLSRTVGITLGDNDATIMIAMLKKAGIRYRMAEGGISPLLNAESGPFVVLQPVRYDFAPFLKKNLDLFPVYKNTQGVDIKMQLNAAGEEVGFFDPDQQGGIRFVANSIITTPRMLKENPDVVMSFLAATIAGWKDALDPRKRDLAIRAMIPYVKEFSIDDKETLQKKLKDQIDITADLVLPASKQGISIGTIDVNAWKETESIMLREGIIKARVHIENHLATELIHAH